MGKKMGKKIVALLAVGLFISSACFTKQISFQIVQHDSSSENLRESSLVFEDVFFDDFFDIGFIVTNSKALIANSEEDDNKFMSQGIQEAIEGSSEYFVQIKLYYQQDSNSKNIVLEEVNWSLTSVKTGDVLDSKRIVITSDAQKSLDSNEISAEIFNDLIKSLKA